jgi:chitinase
MNPKAVGWSVALLTAVGVASLSAGDPDRKPAEREAPKQKLVGYFAEWDVYQRKYNAGDVPADKLTHLNYAFAKINDQGECALVDSYAAIDKAYPGDTPDAGVLRGSFHQLQLLKKKHPHLRTLVSVGGWTLSGPFSDAALTEKSRARFAASCVAFMTTYGFDGIDLDWEYPVGGGEEGNKTRKEDKQNFTLLLRELRTQLDAQGKADRRDYLLTIAAPAGPATYANLELGKIHEYLDWLNLMAYDFHGGWSPLTNHHAPLFASSLDPSKDETVRKQFNADAAVKAYLAAGVPAEKVVLGVPFYGRGWGGVAKDNGGLYKKPGPAPQGTGEAGVFDYKDLAANYVGKLTRNWDDEAKAPWLFDEKKGVMISYDDPESLRLKAEYVKKEKLGGVMFWELSGDDAKATLVTTLHDALAKQGGP